MIGTIYTPSRCACGRRYVYDENRAGLFCPVHSDRRAAGPFEVRFGRRIHRRFGYDFRSAETFLLGLRHEVVTDKFDLRDYQQGEPLGFSNLAEQWLKRKRQILKKKSYNNLQNYIIRACKVFGNGNIKTIGGAAIEDFLFDQEVSAKTRSNIKSALHDFWSWLSRREGIRIPDFPDTPFKLGYRDLIDLETQQAIIDEIHRLTYHINPKVWLGVRWLSRYYHVRPGEILRLTEGQVSLKMRALVIPDPKGPEPILVFLYDDDLEELDRLPRGLPDLPFFRHVAGIKGVRAGRKFGDKYLYKAWVRACSNLGLMKTETRPITDLYAGTRHSTVNALAEILSPEEIKRGGAWRTNAAFERYFQERARYAHKVQASVLELQNKARGEVIKWKHARNARKGSTEN